MHFPSHTVYFKHGLFPWSQGQLGFDGSEGGWKGRGTGEEGERGYGGAQRADHASPRSGCATDASSQPCTRLHDDWACRRPTSVRPGPHSRPRLSPTLTATKPQLTPEWGRGSGPGSQPKITQRQHLSLSQRPPSLPVAGMGREQGWPATTPSYAQPAYPQFRPEARCDAAQDPFVLHECKLSASVHYAWNSDFLAHFHTCDTLITTRPNWQPDRFLQFPPSSPQNLINYKPTETKPLPSCSFTRIRAGVLRGAGASPWVPRPLPSLGHAWAQRGP